MLRRKLLCVLTLCAVVLAVPVWALSAEEVANKIDEKCQPILNRLLDMGDKIVAYNKPSSTKYVKHQYGGGRWNRVWKKKGTEVEGGAVRRMESIRYASSR